MKICFVIPDMMGMAGGWGRYADDLILCAENSGHTTLRVMLRGTRPGFSDVLRIMRVAGSCDVVYAIDGWPFGAAAWLATRFSRTPLIVGGIGTYTIAPLYRRATSWLMTRVYRSAQSVVCISGYTEQRLKQVVPEARTTVVTPGIPYEKWAVNHRSDADMVMISVGAVKERKGYHHAMEAFARVKKRIPSLRWTIVGGTGHASYVDALKVRAVELGVSDSVRFAGQVEDAELRRLYAQSRLFVLLSENRGNHFEGFGIVFLEAAAAGLPVVGTTGNGIVDAVSPDNGILVPQGDAEAAAEAIAAILSDTERGRRMGGASREWARMHDTRKMCGELEAVYAHIASSMRSRRT